MGRSAVQLVEGLDALTIGEEKIDHDRCEVFPSLAAQPFQCVAASTHPFDVEGTVA